MKKELINDNTSSESPEKTLETFGLVIKELRRAYGETQNEFSLKQGIARTSLQNAEYGRNISLLTFLRIIDGLVSPSEFFDLMK